MIFQYFYVHVIFGLEDAGRFLIYQSGRIITIHQPEKFGQTTYNY